MGIFYQNRLKTGLSKSKVDYTKIQDYLVLLTIGSCSKGNASMWAWNEEQGAGMMDPFWGIL